MMGANAWPIKPGHAISASIRIVAAWCAMIMPVSVSMLRDIVGCEQSRILTHPAAESAKTRACWVSTVAMAN